MESLARSNGAPFSSSSCRSKECGLTLRSSGLAPAWHLARAAPWFIIRLAGQAPHRRSPLSSNVGPHWEPHALLSALGILSFGPGKFHCALLRHAAQSQAHTGASRRRAAPGSQTVKALRAASAQLIGARTIRLRRSPPVERLRRIGRGCLFVAMSVHLAALLSASSLRPSTLGSSRLPGFSWARCT